MSTDGPTDPEVNPEGRDVESAYPIPPSLLQHPLPIEQHDLPPEPEDVITLDDPDDPLLPARNAESSPEAVEVAIDLSEQVEKEPPEPIPNSMPMTEKAVLAAAPVEEKFVGNG